MKRLFSRVLAALFIVAWALPAPAQIGPRWVALYAPPRAVAVAAGSSATYQASTVITFIGGAQSGINYNVGSATAGSSLMVCYSMNNGPLGAPTLAGSGAMTMLNSNTGGAMNHQLWTAVLNSTDISTHTLSVSSGAVADFGISCMVYSGVTTAIYRGFDTQVQPSSQLSFTSFTPDVASKGEVIMGMESNNDVASLSVTPGTWTTRYTSTSLSAGYYRAAGGLDALTASSGAAKTVNGFGTAGFQGGFQIEVAP